MKPKKRSWLHLQLGMLYFRMRRRLQWTFSRVRYTSEQVQTPWEKTPYRHVAFTHRTLLLRKLRHVDMWLQHNKVHNLTLAIPRLNGLVLRPGDTMSYWKLIGNPTKAKGYLPGMVLHEGGFRAETGGGLCQLSNLIYWMTLHTPLTVTERYRHQYDVFPDSNRTQPFGSGATCAYNYVDLQIRNDTERTYVLHLFLTETHLVGEWRTEEPQTERYEVFEREHAFRQEAWGGYTRHNQIWRRVLGEDGEERRQEFVTENHAIMMYAPLLPEAAAGGN
ncbi:VanW family protein [Tumebacillus flagellatus]|uniref:Vancomycin resistance protein n=1 Tax=Tumebacillus flagellatus TaxID=1157490 RepID=A0A074LPJ6_9BACL|nr:VanW family protein [Tumebacillus flagellatus]KEO83004.1 vancomycin resistance protein [Tumebacillus flagellatus]